MKKDTVCYKYYYDLSVTNLVHTDMFCVVTVYLISEYLFRTAGYHNINFQIRINIEIAVSVDIEY